MEMIDGLAPILPTIYGNSISVGEPQTFGDFTNFEQKMTHQMLMVNSGATHFLRFRR
jgi:hypothetical protein